jgi:predicted ATP-dependent endonuclease of OLD family
LPNLILFSEIDLLEDSANKDKFFANKKEYKTLYNLIKLSNLNIQKLRDAPEHRIINDTRRASTKITGLVNESWDQDKVKIDIDARGEEIIVLIKDHKTKMLQKPSRRSQGFQWFLSFYINFTADPEGEFKDAIILLDDPGVHLHASGQKDLLKTLENVSQTNQIVFSTHSPFMIDKDNLRRIRIVSKEEGEGTTINENFYKSNYNSFAPIKASIGMDIGNSLFIDKKTLIVEGNAGDILLRSMSELLVKRNLEMLGYENITEMTSLSDLLAKQGNWINTSKIAILPINSVDKAKYFIPFLLNQNIAFTILLNYDSKSRKKNRRIKSRNWK